MWDIMYGMIDRYQGDQAITIACACMHMHVTYVWGQLVSIALCCAVQLYTKTVNCIE